jgi:hypothetical protein
MKPYCFSLPERSVRNEEDSLADCSYCDHFESCQEAYPNRPKILTLHLKEQYFFDIDQGKKLDEYREASHYWRQRLQGKTFDVIEICRSYPERGDCDNRIWFSFEEIRLALMEWDNGGLKVKGPTFVISLRGNRLYYPYQVKEQNSQDKPAVSA